MNNSLNKKKGKSYKTHNNAILPKPILQRGSSSFSTGTGSSKTVSQRDNNSATEYVEYLQQKMNTPHALKYQKEQRKFHHSSKRNVSDLHSTPLIAANGYHKSNQNNQLNSPRTHKRKRISIASSSDRDSMFSAIMPAEAAAATASGRNWKQIKNKNMFHNNNSYHIIRKASNMNTTPQLHQNSDNNKRQLSVDTALNVPPSDRPAPQSTHPTQSSHPSQESQPLQSSHPPQSSPTHLPIAATRSEETTTIPTIAKKSPATEQAAEDEIILFKMIESSIREQVNEGIENQIYELLLENISDTESIEDQNPICCDHQIDCFTDRTSTVTKDKLSNGHDNSSILPSIIYNSTDRNATTEELINSDDEPPSLVSSPEDIEQSKKIYRDAFEMVNSVIGGENLFDDDNEFSLTVPSQNIEEAALKINHKKNTKKLSDFVTCDGIVLVSIKHSTKPIRILWPGRILSALDSKYMRKSLKGSDTQKGKICVILYFPFKFDSMVEILNQENVPENWWQVHFASEDEIFPFDEKEDENLEELCIDTYRRFHRGLCIAAGLKKWVLASGLTRPKSKILANQRENNIHSKISSNFNHVLAIDGPEWLRVSKTQDSQEIVEMIDAKTKNIAGNIGKQKSKNKGTGTSCTSKGEKPAPVSIPNCNKAKRKYSNAEFEIHASTSVEQSSKLIAKERRHSISDQSSLKKIRKPSFSGNDKSRISNNSNPQDQLSSTNVVEKTKKNEKESSSTQQSQETAEDNSPSHYSLLKQICHRMKGRGISVQTKDIYEYLHSIPKTNGVGTDLDVGVLLKAMSKMVDKIHELDN